MLKKDLVAECYKAGVEILRQRRLEERKAKGQFLTPPEVARYMAGLLGELPRKVFVLDPALGSGVLPCAIIERAIFEETRPIDIHVTAYEIDKELFSVSYNIMKAVADVAQKHNIRVTLDIHHENFLEGFEKLLRERRFDIIIANPPYFKVSRTDPRILGTIAILGRHTNIYSAFMMASLILLSEQGKGVFIVPRSFFAGLYFNDFRRRVTRAARLSHIHVFESRSEVFRQDAVLQENVIVLFEKDTSQNATISISTSFGAKDLDDSRRVIRRVPYSHVVYTKDRKVFFRLPTSELDDKIIKTFDSWPGSFEKYGLAVSTGPVVPFRAQDALCTSEEVKCGKAVPLYWLINVKPRRLVWPVYNKKPQGIYKHAKRLLLPARNYVFLRRFSAKEEPRRLIAAPFLQSIYPYEYVGIENHINYIHKLQGELTTEEVLGITAFLNSALVDRYFRILSSNTQVNATEIRLLPLPPLEVLQEIGQQVHELRMNMREEEEEEIVYQVLKDSRLLDDDLPFFKEARFAMGKIQEAQVILQSLGLPDKQRNEIAALTLLVLAQLDEKASWQQARKKGLRIHDILEEIKERFGRIYAENTRETIRRQVIHHFLQRGIVQKNPDNPSLPTNSPRTHYALTDEALAVLRAFNTDVWEERVQEFLEQHGEIIRRYRAAQEKHRIPLKLPTGEEFSLSPGLHNKLQAQVINEFGPRFAPGSKVVYLGDTENKLLHFDRETLEYLGVQITEHGKLPDIILYSEAKNRLYLIEVVTSHGPVSHKRLIELEEMFGLSKARRIYISAFPDFQEFARHMRDIAWDTEVWLASHPDHLIHFNGDKFFHAY